MGSRSCCIGLIVLWLALAGWARAAVPGDVDCDGRVNGADLTLLVADMFGDAAGGSPIDGGCAGADQNGDGVATAADLVVVVRAEGQPVATPTPRNGPAISFFGLVGADGTVGAAVMGDARVPVFQRSGPSGFQVVVEAIPGADGAAVGTVIFNSSASDAAARPDLQIEASRDLGDGNPDVCTGGGIRGFDPPDFSLTREVSDALNDFGCGFGVNTNAMKACTVDSFGAPSFVSTASHVVQFCLLISGAKAFELGDTTLTVQVRDVAGNLGDAAQIVVRVGTTATPVPSALATSSMTPTSTSSPTRAPVSTPTGTRASATLTPSPTPGPSGSPTPTITGTRPATSTPTCTPSASQTATPSSSPTNPPPGSPSATATFSRSPTSTPTVTLTRTATRTATPTSSPTVTRTPTVTLSPSSTRTPTNTQTPTSTPTVTLTPSVTRTPTTTRTPTATLPPEPVITFFGVTRSTDTLVDPSGMAGSIPIYQRSSTNFSLVIEGRPGGTGSPIGTSTYNWDPTQPTVLPYLLIEASNPLGQNPTTLVCDDTPGMAGGVPGTDPPDFSPTQRVADVINDFACRFKDSTGTRNGRGANDACTLFENDSPLYHFVNPTAPQFPSTIQFCGQISTPIAFPVGQTKVTARIRDLAGNVSAPAQIIISVSAP